MASWATQRENIRQAVEAGSRARDTDDGSRVLGLRRGRGAYALLQRADGSVTRAGEAYFGMLGRQPESRTFDPRQPLVREGAADYVLLQNGQRGLVRRLREDGTYQLTNLGRRFFKNKCSQHVAHIPAVIRGMRRAGKNAGRAYEQGLAPRKCPGWRGQPAARQAVGAANTAKRQAGDAAADNRGGRGPRRRQGAHHGTQRRDVLLRPGGGVGGVLRDDAIQEQPRTHRNHPAAEAARPAPRVVPTASTVSWNAHSRIPGTTPACRGSWLNSWACPSRRSAETSTPLQSTTGARTASRRWRYEPSARGATRPMVLISNTGEPLDRFEPAQRETKTVVFTYYDGHAFFYRNARPVPEQMGCALVMYRRDPKQTVPPLEEWSPWWGEIKPAHFHTTDLRETRRQLLLAEHNPQVTLRSLAQFSSLKLRAKGGQCVIRELPEDWELLQAEAGLAELRGFLHAGQGAEDHPEPAAEEAAAGQAGRQVRRLRAADRRRVRGVRPHRAGAAGLRRAAAALPGALL